MDMIDPRDHTLEELIPHLKKILPDARVMINSRPLWSPVDGPTTIRIEHISLDGGWIELFEHEFREMVGY